MVFFQKGLKIKLTDYWALFFFLFDDIYFDFFLWLLFGNVNLTLCCIVLNGRTWFEIVIRWFCKHFWFEVLFWFLFICLIEITINLLIFSHGSFSGAKSHMLKVLIIIIIILVFHLFWVLNKEYAYEYKFQKKKWTLIIFQQSFLLTLKLIWWSSE